MISLGVCLLLINAALSTNVDPNYRPRQPDYSIARMGPVPTNSSIQPSHREHSPPRKRQGFMPWNMKWDQNPCIPQGETRTFNCIPYTLDPQIGNMEEFYVGVINKAMQWFRDNTCIAFVERTTETDYLYIRLATDGGCNSDVLGRKGGYQSVELDPACIVYPQDPFHEMMHVLGFTHEHQLPNRDQYLTINADNIDPKFMYAFDKWPANQVTLYDFDYDSVMLYGSRGFQKASIANCDEPRCWTITKKDGTRILDNYLKTGPSVGDYKSINTYYQCVAGQ